MSRRRKFRRSKKAFRSARAAWTDIRRSIRGDYRGIKSGPHTRTHWVFSVT